MNHCSKAILAAISSAVLFTLPFTMQGKAGQSNMAEPSTAAIRAEAIRADMGFLADDLLEGRGTGTRGQEIAAKYIAAQFEQMGLEPAGDHGGYFQNVPLRSGRPDEEKSTLTLARGEKKEQLVFRRDFITSADPGRAESSVEAPLVYAGDGVTAPEQNYDDYKGIDARGKIVVVSWEAPHFESSLQAHYSAIEVKEAIAVAHGAVGMIILWDPILEDVYPYAKQTRDLDFPQFHWLDKQGRPNDYFPELKGQAILSLEEARKLFEGSGHTAQEVFADIKAGTPKSFALPLTANIHNVTKLEDVRSPNVVARLTGSDPQLRSEYVIYSSHSDHLGMGRPVNGDGIYNGALDNASGSALLVEIARAFTKQNPRPRRSLLFLSVTGEEAGLLGSDYFAHYPTVEKDAIVADVNMDMDQLLWPLEDIIAFGAEHSSLGEVVRKAAERSHIAVSPDPMPDEGWFVRSDQYSFVKQGVPAVWSMPGFKSSDPKIKPEAIFKKWEAERYHEPGDDMKQPGLLFEEAAKYGRFVFLCGEIIANETARPVWNKADFFGDRYGKKRE